MNNRFGTALLTAAVLMVGWIQPRAQQDPDDHGLADTVRMEVAVRPDANTNQLNVSIDLWLFNDVQTLNSISLGFKWINPSSRSSAVFFGTSENNLESFNSKSSCNSS